MIKILLGNVLFAAIIGCWYLYVDGDARWVVAGVLMAFPCFICGIVMGYLLRGPGRIRRVVVHTSAPEPTFAIGDTPVSESAELQTAAVSSEHHEPHDDSIPVGLGSVPIDTLSAHDEPQEALLLDDDAETEEKAATASPEQPQPDAMPAVAVPAAAVRMAEADSASGALSI